jgi:hypothetical protein
MGWIPPYFHIRALTQGAYRLLLQAELPGLPARSTSTASNACIVGRRCGDGWGDHGVAICP